jgi:PilZ domain
MHKGRCKMDPEKCTSVSACGDEDANMQNWRGDQEACAFDYYSENFGALGQSAKSHYIDNGFQIIQALRMNLSNPDSADSNRGPITSVGRQEVRCAVRFPLSLPVVLSTGESDVEGHTRNVSASGVLFALNQALRVGSDVRFSMRMPRETLGSPQDVVVHCKGRVVRCSSSHNEHLAAATIDEYRFAEH